MFCPECEAEYREGFTHCSDCGVTLVEALPDEAEVDHSPSYEEIKANINPTQVALLKSMLEAEGIDHFLHGEEFARLITPLALLSPVRLLVPADRAERVREILSEMRALVSSDDG